MLIKTSNYQIFFLCCWLVLGTQHIYNDNKNNDNHKIIKEVENTNDFSNINIFKRIKLLTQFHSPNNRLSNVLPLRGMRLLEIIGELLEMRLIHLLWKFKPLKLNKAEAFRNDDNVFIEFITWGIGTFSPRKCYLTPALGVYGKSVLK